MTTTLDKELPCHHAESLSSPGVALADSYDAMISNCTYRPALSQEEAAREIQAAAGAQFDAALAEALLTVLSQGKEADFAIRPIPVCRRAAVY